LSLRYRTGHQECLWAGEGWKDLSRIGSLLNQCVLSAKRVFHLLIALAFLFLTLMGASVTYTEWEGYRQAPQQGYIHLAMFGGFTIFLAILCLYSFAKARSVR
jgi:hypothetical protein